VLEEIDAIGDIVKQRRPSGAGAGAGAGAGGSESTAVNDELTLGEILTVLDGTMEVPGRMIVMTTNHPEVLDDALIRPGRIDVQAAFTYATRELIADMYIAYLEKELSPESIAQLPNAVLSPAEVGQVLFRHFGMPSTEDEIVADLVKTAGISFAKRLARSATVTAVITAPPPAPAPVRVEPPAVTPANAASAGAAPAPTVMPVKTSDPSSKSAATSPVGATKFPIKPVVATTHSAMEAAAKSKQLDALPMFSPEIEMEMNDSGSALHFTPLDPEMEPVDRYAPAV